MRATFTLVAALLLAGCGLLGDRGTVYPIAARDARAKLLLTEPPMFLFGESAHKARVSRDAEGTVRWLLVDRQGTGLLALVAKTQEVDAASTRVTVSIEPPPGGLHDKVAERLAGNSSIVAFYKAAMEEQIAAEFQNREFEMAAIQDEMMVAALANVGNIAESADKAAEESNARDRANIERAYANEGRNWPESSSVYGAQEPAYGEPMDPAAGSDY